VPTYNSPSLSRITIGSFDGLHIGHQTIIHHLVRDAHHQEQKAVVITFFPNPLVFLKNITSPFYLTTNFEKTALLKQWGVDQTVILPFNHKLANMRAAQFILNLHQSIPFTSIYAGYDFHFGVNREGDSALLLELGKQYSFSVFIQDPIRNNSNPISSSVIRTYISEGRVGEVYALLNRWYALSGEIIHGDGRGKKLGIPTANIAYEAQKLLPANGIYATRIHIDDEIYPAATNIGFRPTFYNQPSQKTVEAFILDWDKDIYGKTVSLEFIRKLRDEIKYEQVQLLKEQIHKDIEETRKIFNHANE